MEEIEIKNQNDLDEIIGDTSLNGGVIIFYEMLQKSLIQYSEQRVERMRDVIKFTLEGNPNLYGSEIIPDNLSKLDVLYYYSLLP